MTTTTAVTLPTYPDTLESEERRACPQRNRIRELLHASGVSELKWLDVQTTEHYVRLHGKVSAFYLKALAQTVIRPALGTREVVNHIEVDPWA